MLCWRPAFLLTVGLRSQSQICHEFERFSVYMTNVKVANFYGGIPIKTNREALENDPPHIVVGTPGRIKQVGIAVL